MKAWITRGWKACRKQPAAVVLTLALAAAFVVYTSFAPARAGVSSNTAPLDNSQVGALLSLDQAMEAVAARVTPAIVNVAVTSREKSQPVARRHSRRNAALLRPAIRRPGNAAAAAH